MSNTTRMFVFVLVLIVPLGAEIEEYEETREYRPDGTLVRRVVRRVVTLFY